MYKQKIIICGFVFVISWISISQISLIYSVAAEIDMPGSSNELSQITDSQKSVNLGQRIVAEKSSERLVLQGIALDNAGFLYVADNQDESIRKFDLKGELISKWKDKGLFSLPFGIAVDSKNNIYVADPNNYTIKKFNNEGELLLEWGRKGNNNGEFKDLRGISVDSLGNIYIVDASKNDIQKFSPKGDYVGKVWNGEYLDFQESGNYLDCPRYICVDNKGNVYVTDNEGVLQFSSADFR